MKHIRLAFCTRWVNNSRTDNILEWRQQTFSYPSMVLLFQRITTMYYGEGCKEVASSPDVVLISVKARMTSSPQRLGGLLLLRLSHGTDLHIEDYNIRVRVHSLRSRCSYHTGMTSTNTDNHSVVCELGLHCYSNPNCLLTNACCNVLRSFLIDT